MYFLYEENCLIVFPIRIMKLMPLIFTVFFLWFPAGLVLYWLVNNILSIAQQWYITRKIETEMAGKKH